MKIYHLIFTILLNLSGSITYAACVSTPYACGYCAATSCSCSNTQISEPSITVNTIRFNWSHNDTNTGNDVCSGSVGGPCHCNAGTTNYSNNTLTALNDACTWPGLRNRLPASGVICRWRDGVCGTYCSNYISATCWTSCP